MPSQLRVWQTKEMTGQVNNFLCLPTGILYIFAKYLCSVETELCVGQEEEVQEEGDYGVA